MGGQDVASLTLDGLEQRWNTFSCGLGRGVGRVVGPATGLVAVVVVATDFFVVNHRERIARQESITTYYGQLHFAH